MSSCKLLFDKLEVSATDELIAYDEVPCNEPVILGAIKEPVRLKMSLTYVKLEDAVAAFVVPSDNIILP